MADEILKAKGDQVAALVGAVGSGGSLCGTARRLRETIPSLRIVAVDAVGSVLFHQPDRLRLQSGHGNSIISGNIAYDLIDEVHWINDGEAFAAARELSRREGIFAGGSSGAAYIVASWVAEQFDRSQCVIVVFPDRGDRYADAIYSDTYMASHGLAGVEAANAPTRIRYGLEVADHWSFSELPHDRTVPYYSPDAKRSDQIALELGL